MCVRIANLVSVNSRVARYATLPFAVTLAFISLCFQTDASVLRGGMDAQMLHANDDGSTGPVDLGFSIDFFGAEASKVFVNNNGNVTLHEGMRRYTPEPLSTIDVPIIAPFFSDVDTANGIGGNVTFGQGRVGWRRAFAVNWIDVNFYGNHVHANHLNSFQMVIIDRHETGLGNFDVEFNYGQILWESTISSGGDPMGHGGQTARAGFSAGTNVPGSYIELEGSGIAGSFLDGGTRPLATSSNVEMAGRFVFNVREGSISVPPPSAVIDTDLSAVPLPASAILLLAAIFGLALAKRRTGY